MAVKHGPSRSDLFNNVFFWLAAIAIAYECVLGAFWGVYFGMAQLQMLPADADVYSLLPDLTWTSETLFYANNLMFFGSLALLVWQRRAALWLYIASVIVDKSDWIYYLNSDAWDEFFGSVLTYLMFISQGLGLYALLTLVMTGKLR
ncbi:hypothetical protein [Maricaulis sp. CAU 1757]